MSCIPGFLERAKVEDLVINYVQIRKQGEIAEEYQRLESKTRLNTWSVSKSFVSVGVGIAMEEGLFTLEDSICDAFHEYVPKGASKELRSLRVKDLLNMTTGLENALFFADDVKRYQTKDWISYFFHAPFTRMPGEKFLYSNFNTYMLSCLIERKSGQNLLEFLRYRLFEPLDILSPDWTYDPLGHIHAANGLYVTIDELGNFGQMLLNNGTYKKKRIVSAEYLSQAMKNQLSDGVEDAPEYGYGYQFWGNPDGKTFRADGKFGQYVIVLPEKEAVIAVQSLESKDVFSLVWEELAEKI